MVKYTVKLYFGSNASITLVGVTSNTNIQDVLDNYTEPKTKWLDLITPNRVVRVRTDSIVAIIAEEEKNEPSA
jgi:hypothetical protein